MHGGLLSNNKTKFKFIGKPTARPYLGKSVITFRGLKHATRYDN
jgi:hypothetical protein